MENWLKFIFSTKLVFILRIFYNKHGCIFSMQYSPSPSAKLIKNWTCFWEFLSFILIFCNITYICKQCMDPVCGPPRALIIIIIFIRQCIITIRLQNYLKILLENNCNINLKVMYIQNQASRYLGALLVINNSIKPYKIH